MKKKLAEANFMCSFHWTCDHISVSSGNSILRNIQKSSNLLNNFSFHAKTPNTREYLPPL